jgi:hypothetical protein
MKEAASRMGNLLRSPESPALAMFFVEGPTGGPPVFWRQCAASLLLNQAKWFYG